MNVIHPHLHARRRRRIHARELADLAIADLSAVDDPAVRLLNAVPVHLILQKEREIRIEVELVVLGIGVGVQLAAGRRVVMIVQPARSASRFAPFGRVDRAEAVERAVCYRPKRDFTGRIPVGAVIGGGEAQFRPARRIDRGFAQHVGSKIAVVVLERTVRVIAFSGQQRPHLVFRRRQHQEVPLSIELPAGQLHQALLDHLARSEADRPGRVEVAELGVIRAFVHVEAFDGLGNDEIEVGITLPVRMGAKIDRHAIGEERDIGAVIRIEAAEEVLIRLAGSARVLHRDEPGDQTQNLGRPSLGLEQVFLVRDELLRRRRHRSLGDDFHLRKLDTFVGRLVRPHRRDN